MSFNFAINRVACAQICRASGIDRCSPVALDSLSDIMSRFMGLLAKKTRKAAELKGSSEPTVDDVVFALEELHMLAPHLDQSDCEGIQELLAWLKGPAPQRALQVSKLQQQALSALGAAQGAVLAQQGSHEMQGQGAKVDTSADWLQQMVEKQVLMGHDHKFQSTVFGERDERPGETVGTEFLRSASPGLQGAAAEVVVPPPQEVQAELQEESHEMQEVQGEPQEPQEPEGEQAEQPAQEVAEIIAETPEPVE